MSVSWTDVKQQFGWLKTGQGESVLVNYLLFHPDRIEKGLELVGLEIAIPQDGSRKVNFIDMLFKKERTYFVVEVKESVRQKGAAEKEVLRYVEAVESYFRKYGIPFDEIVPVFTGMEFPPNAQYRYRVGKPFP